MLGVVTPVDISILKRDVRTRRNGITPNLLIINLGRDLRLLKSTDEC